MQTLSEIRALLEARGMRPRKSLGQNFLHDHNQLRKLIDAASVSPGDLVLEVGPGTGTLTETLLDAGAEIIACELDDGLAQLLTDRFGNRITLVHDDCLGKSRAINQKIVEAIGGRPFKLVANLPYQAASPLMTTLLIEHADTCTGQFVTIQKEVTDRLLAGPNTKAYGPLGIITQAFATVERICTVPAGCFWPAPKVTSAMVAILPAPSGRGGGGEAACFSGASVRRAFARFITELFMKRRKVLRASVDPAVLHQCSIDSEARPEQLSVDQFVSLWRASDGPTCGISAD